MNARELIITRRSTRKFRESDIEREKLDLIIEAGRHAPSGGNSQATRFIVICDRKVLDELAVMIQAEFASREVTPGMYRSMANNINAAKRGALVFHYNAPVLIVTANKKDYGNNMADCACALENMMLMSNALDLGSCWINQLKWLNEDTRLLEYFRNLGLEDDERIYGAVAVGYPATEDGLPLRDPLPRTGNPVVYID